MAFLDNSGDIILDAVLTDLGRQRLARGDFSIKKFALGDEEINYETFNPAHPSGSAWADLEIMQTPILEAFTNNASLMRSKLVTLSRNNILYMPVFRLNTLNIHNARPFTHAGFNNTYVIIADANTARDANGVALDASMWVDGVLRGYAPTEDTNTNKIVVDQGMITGGHPGINISMPDDLIEGAYLIRMDHRLLRLVKPTNQNPAADPRNSFVDDDAIASYYVRGASWGAPIGTIEVDTPEGLQQVFDGPLGRRLRFALRTSLHLQHSDALFTELGGTWTIAADALSTDDAHHAVGGTLKYIDTMINVIGISTGYSIDIPVRIVRK